MKLNWIACTLALIIVSGSSVAQSWTSTYESGLKSAKAGRWADARKSFLMARANRPEDSANATTLPGPVANRQQWRNGAPYSPNFLAAYCAYKSATGSSKEDEAMLKSATDELESLISKKQVSKEAVFLLNSIYARLKANDRATALSAKAANANWKVDSEGLSSEDIAGMGMASTGGKGGIIASIPAGSLTSPYGGLGNVGIMATGPVPIMAKKFALIIANTESKLPGGKLVHGADDARVVREALNSGAGYDTANIETLINVTADQIKKAAAALAARMPEEGTLFLFYTGNGVNIEGRDWLAGTSTELATDTASMVSKTDLFQPFIAKGTKVFSFFQVDRKQNNGQYFGTESAKFGQISQMQATVPGESIYSSFRGGKQIGIFADAMASVVSELHSNQIPIAEFGWQVFYKIRRGNTGDSGGGSRQVPTLPVLQLLASNARF